MMFLQQIIPPGTVYRLIADLESSLVERILFVANCNLLMDVMRDVLMILFSQAGVVWVVLSCWSRRREDLGVLLTSSLR